MAEAPPGRKKAGGGKKDEAPLEPAARMLLRLGAFGTVLLGSLDDSEGHDSGWYCRVVSRGGLVVRQAVRKTIIGAIAAVLEEGDKRPCGNCRSNLPLDAFGPKKCERSGLGGRCRYCRACERARRAMARRKARGLDPLAVEGGVAADLRPGRPRLTPPPDAPAPGPARSSPR